MERWVGAWLSLFLVAAPAARAEGRLDVATARGALVGNDVEAAAAAVDALGNAKQVTALLDALADGVHPEVAVRALVALQKIGDRRAEPTYFAYSRHRVPAVRAAALPGLARAGKEGERRILAALGDPAVEVRAAAIRVATERKWAKVVPQLMLLLAKKDPAAAPALGAFGDPALAKRIAEMGGKIPDELISQALSGMLANPKFGKEEDYVELVEMIGRLPGDEPVTALAAFLGTQPENSTRPSVKAARDVIEERLGGVK
jgi:hypothetical protein